MICKKMDKTEIKFSSSTNAQHSFQTHPGYNLLVTPVTSVPQTKRQTLVLAYYFTTLPALSLLPFPLSLM